LMDNSLRELYQEVILDHSRHPRHFGVLEHATHKAEGYNPLCGDRVTVTLVLGADNRVADIKFTGKGCAISQASASMMTDMLAGRTVEEANALMDGFVHLVKGEEAPGLSADDRERLDVMAGLSEFPMRVKCATLAWHTFSNALEEGAAS
jgi:nitrogen fixation NifU-like protein